MNFFPVQRLSGYLKLLKKLFVTWSGFRILDNPFWLCFCYQSFENLTDLLLFESRMMPHLFIATFAEMFLMLFFIINNLSPIKITQNSLKNHRSPRIEIVLFWLDSGQKTHNQPTNQPAPHTYWHIYSLQKTEKQPQTLKL